MNVSFEVSKMEQERFYLNGWKAGALGEECPPGAQSEFFNGWHAAQDVRAQLDIGLVLAGLREGLSGTAPDGGSTCEAIEKGREEGSRIRRLIQDEAWRAQADLAQSQAHVRKLAAANEKIRAILAPLLGMSQDQDSPEGMVARFVGLQAEFWTTQKARIREEAMEWAAVLAGDFDPFSREFTDVERAAGEHVLGLFAEKLRREAGLTPKMRGGVDGVETAWERHAAGVGAHTSPAQIDPKAPVSVGPMSVGGLSSSPPVVNRWEVSNRAPSYAPNDWTPIEVVRFFLPRSGIVKMTVHAMVEGGQVGLSADNVAASFVSSMGPRGGYSASETVEMAAGWHTFALMGRQGARVEDRTLTVALSPEPPGEEWHRRWLSEAEIAGVRALLRGAHRE